MALVDCSGRFLNLKIPAGSSFEVGILQILASYGIHTALCFTIIHPFYYDSPIATTLEIQGHLHSSLRVKDLVVKKLTVLQLAQSQANIASCGRSSGCGPMIFDLPSPRNLTLSFPWFAYHRHLLLSIITKVDKRC